MENAKVSLVALAALGLLSASCQKGDAEGSGEKGSPVSKVEGDKNCCMGKNSCKGKGGCAVPGKNSCAGKNECKGQGGCNMHCEK
jgi:hypothetical protein